MRLNVDLERGEAWAGRNRVPRLTYTELRALVRLIRGDTVSRGALLVAAWPRRSPAEAGASRKVDMAVARLRAKLAKVGVRIRAVPGEGYRI